MSRARHAVQSWPEMLKPMLSRNKKVMPMAKYVQLATVREDGRPACRTVVYRGLLPVEPRNSLMFITDIRSHKVREIAARPWGEVCWYLTESRDQLRISGDLRVITAADTAAEALMRQRTSVWKNLSPGARSQFAWADPGVKLPDEAAAGSGGDGDAAGAGAGAADVGGISPTEPHANFCLVLLNPVHIDHVALRGQRHWIHTRHAASDGNSKEGEKKEVGNGEWTVEEVTP